MAYVITDACSACGLCLHECPIEAIRAGDPIYVIDDTCCEFTECVAVCPEEAIIHEDVQFDASDQPGSNLHPDQDG